MTRRVIVVPPELPLSAAWQVMQRERFRHLPVVSHGALLGMLSDRDVLLHSSLSSDGEVLAPDTPVGEAMSVSPQVCLPDTHIADVVRMMTERKVDAVAVVSETDQLVGLITTTDLLLLLIELDEAKLPLPFEFELESHMPLGARI